jgi:hypothetical protein
LRADPIESKGKTNKTKPKRKRIKIKKYQFRKKEKEPHKLEKPFKLVLISKSHNL